MSCLVERFSYYLALDENEKRQLEDIEKEAVELKKGHVVYEQDAETNNIYVVKSGWLISYSCLRDGGRLVMNVHLPGDIIGLNSVPYHQCADGLQVVQKAVLCPFPKIGLRKIFTDMPRLAALLFSASVQENIVLHDRLKAIGRMAGENRIALLMLQLQARLKLTHRNMSNTFDMPLSQEIIGDALGITPVYVNRMLRQLQEDGWIKYNKPTLTLLKVDEMKQRCDFKDRYYKMDTNWLLSQM